MVVPEYLNTKQTQFAEISSEESIKLKLTRIRKNTKGTDGSEGTAHHKFGL
jgi:hypothetical protein